MRIRTITEKVADFCPGVAQARNADGSYGEEHGYIALFNTRDVTVPETWVKVDGQPLHFYVPMSDLIWVCLGGD